MDTIPQDTPQKQCNRCKRILPTANFAVDRSKKDGLRTLCKVCTKTKAPKPTPPPVPEGYKQCRDCKQIKPASTDFFNKTALYQSPDGLNKQCRECRNAYRKRSTQATSPVPSPKNETITCLECQKDLPATLEYFSFNRSTADRLAHICKTCANRKSQKYRDRHGGKEARQAYRKSRAEHDKQYRKMYRETHREHELQYRRMYHASHRERERAYRITYRQSHIEAFRTRTLNRIARKKTTPGTHTPQQIREQYKRQRGKCYYCKQKVKWGTHHVDHTFPLSREHARNSIDHLVIACVTCNLKKGSKYPWEWPEGGRLL